ncbi:MAG: hypothetical protein LBN23_07125 [Paludibacter sp.]|jgi:hypothetical protein|nr:hypothetical protein [Paludibacter sp.]
MMQKIRLQAVLPRGREYDAKNPFASSFINTALLSLFVRGCRLGCSDNGCALSEYMQKVTNPLFR